MKLKRPGDAPMPWKVELKNRLRLFGHRNWIVVADSAYPAQSNPGIETIVAGADHFEVLRTVLHEIAECRHVRPVVYADLELKYVPEDDAPGVTEFRNELHSMVKEMQMLHHEGIISKLDQSARLFRTLVIKTNLTMPYTSVFFELDCGYWGKQAEARLREAIQGD